MRLLGFITGLRYHYRSKDKIFDMILEEREEGYYILWSVNGRERSKNVTDHMRDLCLWLNQTGVIGYYDNWDGIEYIAPEKHDPEFDWTLGVSGCYQDYCVTAKGHNGYPNTPPGWKYFCNCLKELGIGDIC